MSSNSHVIGESSEQDETQILNEESNDMSQIALVKASQKALPQSAFTGKNKSLSLQLTYSYPSLKNVKSNDIRPLDNLYKSLKEDKDW